MVFLINQILFLKHFYRKETQEKVEVKEKAGNWNCQQQEEDKEIQEN